MVTTGYIEIRGVYTESVRKNNVTKHTTCNEWVRTNGLKRRWSYYQKSQNQIDHIASQARHRQQQRHQPHKNGPYKFATELSAQEKEKERNREKNLL